MEHGGEREGREEEAEFLGDEAAIGQRHGESEEDQVADQAAENEDDAAISLAGGLQGHLEGDDRGDGQNQGIGGAFDRLFLEGAAGSAFEYEDGRADHKYGIECELHPDTVLQGLDDGVFRVDAAFFSGREAQLGESPAFEDIQKSHGEVDVVCRVTGDNSRGGGGELTLSVRDWQSRNEAPRTRVCP